jgi:DNA polymerase-3 subunit beta
VAEDGLLTMASTNGHKLVVYKTAIDPSIKIPSSTIPTKSLSAIDGDSTMTLTIDNTNCMVETGDTIVTCRPFDGKYPDFKLLLPKSFTRFVAIDRSQLIDALNLMSSIGSENSLVKFAIENDKLTVMSDREGVKGERSIDCDLSGDRVDIAFNLKYLLAQLKTIPSQQIKISINGALEPVVIEPVGSDLDLLCLVMPVALRG